MISSQASHRPPTFEVASVAQSGRVPDRTRSGSDAFWIGGVPDRMRLNRTHSGLDAFQLGRIPDRMHSGSDAFRIERVPDRTHPGSDAFWIGRVPDASRIGQALKTRRYSGLDPDF